MSNRSGQCRHTCIHRLKFFVFRFNFSGHLTVLCLSASTSIDSLFKSHTSFTRHQTETVVEANGSRSKTFNNNVYLDTFYEFIISKKRGIYRQWFIHQESDCAPSGLLRFLHLRRLQEALETEVVGVVVVRRPVGTRAHRLWSQRGEGSGAAPLQVHLQLQQDLQGVGHLRLTAGGVNTAHVFLLSHACVTFTVQRYNNKVIQCVNLYMKHSNGQMSFIKLCLLIIHRRQSITVRLLGSSLKFDIFYISQF